MDQTRGLPKAEFRSGKLATWGVVYLIQVIGEALSQVTPTCRARHPDIPWKQAIGMRNKVVHGYDDLNFDVVWETVQRDIPELVRVLHDAGAVET